MNNMELIGIILSVAFIFFGLIICSTTIVYMRFKKRQSYVLNFVNYIGVLDYYLDKAYTIVYKDKIFVYSVEGQRPTEEEFNQAMKDFCKIVIRLLGTELLKEFYFLCGSPEDFMFVLVEYFQAKTEEDEIREHAVDQLMEKEN